MNYSSNWKCMEGDDLCAVITISETIPPTDNKKYCKLEKNDCSTSCEITCSFETAVKLSSIQWISAARICEVYIVEHGKVKQSYLGTRRCMMLDEKTTIDNSEIQLFSGSMDYTSNSLVDSVAIRFLSIKEKIFNIVQNIVLVGKQTIINAVTSLPAEENPNRLKFPTPIQPEDSFSSALQASFAQQVLFEGKMKSLEERLGLQMERLVSTLTFSYKEQFDEFSKRMEVMEEIVINLVDKVKELEGKVESLSKENNVQ